MLHLTFPNISHKSAYLDMIREWWEFETIPTSPSALFRGETYEEFLEIMEQNRIANQLGVPATLFFLMDDTTLLWAIQIRHHTHHPNLSIDGWCGGNIGYGIRPSTRGKWLAKKMLALWLIEARGLWLDSVIISADDDNPASWRTIESCGGQLIKTITKDDKILRVYSIKL